MSNGISGMEFPKHALNFPRPKPASDAAAGARERNAAVRDGAAPPTRINRGPDAAKAGGGEPKAEVAGGSAEAAEAPEDPKEKQAAGLRAWAEGVEREVRMQQQRLLEQSLKQNGKHVQTSDGKFLVILPEPGAADPESADADGEFPVPEYWNAENTSDRIVHFATQMAAISGMDPAEFAEKIIAAVSAGFDQANAETGDLPGAAGKLNRDTRELVFAKLSKWLEDSKSGEYNLGTLQTAIPTPEVTRGTQDYQQSANSPLHRQGENWVG